MNSIYGRPHTLQKYLKTERHHDKQTLMKKDDVAPILFLRKVFLIIQERGPIL